MAGKIAVVCACANNKGVQMGMLGVRKIIVQVQPGKELQMIATDILSSEHRVIERVIAALEIQAGQIENGGELDPEFFLKSSEFIRGFADGCHHRKEEGVLFKALAANGLSEETGPVAVMLAEHELGRRFNRGMREAALAIQQGDMAARAELLRNVHGYANLLRQHIQKEDRMLFPMASRLIPFAAQGQVVVDFERVEHEESGDGVHEKYLALAAEIERAVGLNPETERQVSGAPGFAGGAPA
jgi:hemerythrin-like domain-containing protein